MNKHRDYIKIKHFQTKRKRGDVSLLLGVSETSLHPKILVQFSNGPVIALIRQRTNFNKFLILAGQTKRASALRNTAVEIDGKTIEQARGQLMYQNLPTPQDHFQHNLCCILQMHVDHEELKEEQSEKEDGNEDWDKISNNDEEEEDKPSIGNNTFEAQVKSSVPTQTGANIKKRIIFTGHADTKPTPGSLVTCHYVSTRPDGSQLDNTYQRNRPYSFIFGVEKTTVGFQEAISTMDTGENSEFVIPWQKLYGTQGLPGNVPQCADLTFNIHLLNPQEQRVIKQTSNNVVTTITDKEIVEDENEVTISEEGYQVVYTKLTIELVKTYSTKAVKKVYFGLDKEKEEKSTGKEQNPIRAKQKVRIRRA